MRAKLSLYILSGFHEIAHQRFELLIAELAGAQNSGGSLRTIRNFLLAMPTVYAVRFCIQLLWISNGTTTGGLR